MNRLRYLTIAAVLPAVHLFLALSSLLVSFSLGMGRFDSGGDMSQLEGLATALSDTLLSSISHVQTKGLSSATVGGHSWKQHSLGCCSCGASMGIGATGEG